METPLPPLVWWKHRLVKEEIALKPKGTVGAESVNTLTEVLNLVANRRGKAQARGAVFVVIREVAGWWALQYGEDQTGDVDLDELVTHDLSLAADPDKPLTFVVDASGRLGKLFAEGGAYPLRPVRRAADGSLTVAADLEDAFRIGAGAAVAACQEPATSREIVNGFVVPHELENHAKNVRWTPGYLFRPGASLTNLSKGLAWMTKHLPPGMPIRAAGWRHSWSPVASCVGGVTILPGGWAGAAPLTEGEALLTARGAPALYRILAGTRIRDVNAKLQDRGRALPYLGGYDGQTIGGVLPTGTHGSVLRFGPLADMVRSIDLVKFDGSLLRIEPARDRVTDPAFLANANPAMELRADDDLFDAVRVGIGSFGIIHSLVLTTVPKFWLREVRSVTEFAAVAQRLGQGKIYDVFETRKRSLDKLANPGLPDDRDAAGGPGLGWPHHPERAYHFELLWNPYNGHTLVTTRHWLDKASREEIEKKEPPFFADPPIRNIFRIFGFDPMAKEFSRPDFIELLTEHLGLPGIDLVEFVAKHNPKSVPGLIDGSIDGLKDKDGFIQRSYNVFNIGRAANMLPSLSATISVPLANDLWLAAAQIIARVSLDKLEEGIVQTAPTSLRFVAGSTAHLADPEDVCKFEIIFGGTSEPTRQNAHALVKAHYLALREALGDRVRLHWGQLIPEGTLDTPDVNGKLPVERSYPKFAQWRELRHGLDPARRGLTEWLKTLLP